MFGSPSNVRDLERRRNESEQHLQELEQQRKVDVQGFKDQIIELKICFEHRFQIIMVEMKRVNSVVSRPDVSDQRHSLVSRKLRDDLFSAITTKYATDGSNPSLPFPSEKLKSDVERRLHEYLPSFHTPTHLPYASVIVFRLSRCSFFLD